MLAISRQLPANDLASIQMVASNMDLLTSCPEELTRVAQVFS